MSFETQKNFLGKTQTISMVEVQSERILSWVRLGFTSLYLIYSIFDILLGKTTFHIFAIQAISIAAILSYSTYNIFRPKIHLFKGSLFLFGFTFLDVTALTFIVWSYYLNGASFSMITGAVYGVYLIVIIFTALHHRSSLSLFCGAISIAAYSLMYFLFLKGAPFTAELITDFFIRILLILTVSEIGSLVSRNNSKTIQQVVTSETRYHNLVHRLPEMLFTLDSNGNFLYSNNASHSILGIPAKVLIGRNISSFLVNHDSLRLDKGGNVKGTFEIYDFSRNRKFVDCVIQAVSEETSSAAFDGLMSDVTDRELAISQREEMVHRLFQFQKMESLGTLASGMAHDFNNILQTVNDLTALTECESQETQTRNRMKLITETLVDARFLITELLALGRKKPLDYKNVNLNSFFNNIVPQFASQLGPNYTLSFEPTNETVWIQADPDYLKRVFQNLIGNARDAMPEGGTIIVSFKTYKGEDDIGMVCIKVSDTGTGIQPELTEKIFDPFFTTKKPGKGTGLGLALVRRILMLHNSTICVEKSGYEGTVFRIEIPRSQETDHENDTKIMLLNRQYSGIIVLDDDPKIREVLTIFLKEFKYPVYEVSNSEEALQKMQTVHDSCDVIIMDWKIGNENPHAVIKALRKIKEDLIIIVVSGYPPQHKSIEEMHIQKWFSKPYDKNQLDIEIQKSLRQMNNTRMRKENTEKG